MNALLRSLFSAAMLVTLAAGAEIASAQAPFGSFHGAPSAGGPQAALCALRSELSRLEQGVDRVLVGCADRNALLDEIAGLLWDLDRLERTLLRPSRFAPQGGRIVALAQHIDEHASELERRVLRAVEWQRRSAGPASVLVAGPAGYSGRGVTVSFGRGRFSLGLPVAQHGFQEARGHYSEHELCALRDSAARVHHFAHELLVSLGL